MRFLKVLGSAAVVVSLIGCTTTNDPMAEDKLIACAGAVTGNLTYMERMALPDDAVITVNLSDISLADAPATVISSVSFRADGRQVPFNFTLPFASEQVKAAQTIAVSAKITQGDRLLFITTTVNEVLTQGKPSTANLVLERVR